MSFDCEICGKSFTQKYSLNRHIQTVHLGEKLFECKTCGKAFGQKADHTRHVQTVHLGEKPFKCKTCGKAFGRKDEHTRHVRTVHLGEKPFECKICDMSFSQKSTLNAHTRCVHGPGRTDQEREYSRDYKAKRRRTDPGFRLLHNLRNRLRYAVTSQGATKSARTLDLTGCTVGHLRSHLEALFQPGMTWQNQGRWEVDHIRPCASFDLNDTVQQRECFHYMNLQPMWASDNKSKGSLWQGTRHRACTHTCSYVESVCI